MQDDETVAAQLSLRFIPDEPADEDYFTTHTEVARAIVSAVVSNSEIKVVGLLGRWGSGKSTVARKVIEALEDREDQAFKVFAYDAWLHQSDPLRRSFLDSLILRLVREDALSRRWIRRLKKFSASVEDTRTIETPELSGDARWLGLSLLAVPVGIGLVGFDTLQAAFGATPTTLGRATVAAGVFLVLVPLLVWLGLYLRRRPWASILDPKLADRRRTFWRDLDDDGEPTRSFRIFTDGPPKHTSTKTFRSVEPTSLEFGREFQRAMREIKKGGHRLVIVIDNLDRVAEGEALGMWATIRSFFLTSDDTEEGRSEPFHPTVILPIDRHAIEDLFAGADDGAGGGRERARSFMDKTFDITFEVTEPIHSDWRLFLRDQMKFMFGDLYEDSWGFWTRRLFESQLTRQQAVSPGSGRPAAVTPREINKLLNRIGALYLQWASVGIPVEVMALYVIRRDDIDQGLLAFLQAGEAEIAEVAPNWQRQLAALYYGVGPEKAAQVLLDEPIRTAILRADEAALLPLSAVPGFGETFEFITGALPEPPTSISAFSIVANAVVLLHAIGSTEDQWAVSAWRKLVVQFNLASKGVIPAVRHLSIIDLLAPRVEPDMRDAFLANATRLVAGQLAQSPATVADSAAVRIAAEKLITWAKTQTLPPPEFTLALEPQPFLVRLSALSGSSAVWPQIRTSHNGETLSEAIIEMLKAPDLQKSVPQAVRLFTFKGGGDLYAGDIEFEGVAETADRLVRDPGSMGGDAPSGLQVLAELSYGAFDEGEARLRALIDDGILSARLDEAVAASEWKNVALMVALQIWRGGVLKAPAAMSWRDYPERDPQHPERIVAVLKSYFGYRLVPILWGTHGAGYANETFLETLIGHAVQSDVLGDFDAAPILAGLHDYRRAVPWRLRETFLDQVHRRTNMLTSIEGEPLGPQLAEAVDYMTRRGGEEAGKAIELVRERVRTASVEEWSRAIRLGQEPFGFSRRVVDEGELKLDGRSPLYQALIEATAIVAGSGGRDVRDRWFKLLELMKVRQAKSLQHALGIALTKASADQALKILMTGGASFLKAAGFAADPDRAVRTIILPQLDRKEGRDWLRENRDDLSSWTARAGPKVRREIEASLKVLQTSKLEERRYTADHLANRWGFDLRG